MKKYVKFGFVVLLIVALVLGIGAYFVVFRFPNASINISSATVDNYYNNYIAGGNACRINNTIYYNYNKSRFNYGLAEITENGSKRIHWNGIHWLEAELPQLLSPIRMYENKLYLTDENKYYDAAEQSFISDDTFHGDFRQTEYGLVYADDENLICENSAGKKQVLLKSYDKCYIANDALYYTLPKRYDTIRKLDLKTGKDEKIAQISSEYMEFARSFFIEKNYVVFESDILNKDKGNYTSGCLFTLELGTDNRQPQLIKSEINGVNVYKNKVYFTSGNGLEVYDLQNKSVQTLCKNSAEKVYILDDGWVYFTDDNSALWRVSNDGAKSEKVFG